MQGTLSASSQPCPIPSMLKGSTPLSVETFETSYFTLNEDFTIKLCIHAYYFLDYSYRLYLEVSKLIFISHSQFLQPDLPRVIWVACNKLAYTHTHTRTYISSNVYKYTSMYG